MLPPDLRTLVDSLDRVDAAVTRLTADLSDAQFNWQPHEGRAWSIGQCLDHLRVSSAVYVPPMAEAAAQARTRGLTRRDPIRPGGWPSKWFVSMMGPQPRVKLKAPGRIVPGATFTRREAVAAFLATQARVREFVQQTADLDLNAVRFANPFITGIRFTVATGLLVIEAHNRRHLWQAERVAAADGFPGR
jgi:DinB superfamily